VHPLHHRHRDGAHGASGRSAWWLFANNYDLFLGTPSRLWLDHALNWGFGISEPLSADNADRTYGLINERLSDDALRPMAILNRARVECIATPEFALDPLKHHSTLKQDGKIGRIRRAMTSGDDVSVPFWPSWLRSMSSAKVRPRSCRSICRAKLARATYRLPAKG